MKWMSISIFLKFYLDNNGNISGAPKAIEDVLHIEELKESP